MIENLSTKKLYDNEYNKIMKEMKLLGAEYSNHKFELLLLGTNNKSYSNLDYSLEPLKKTKYLRKMVNFSLRLLRRYLSYRKKILVSYLNYVWTADLILNNIEPAPVRWVEYPWAITNSKLSSQMKILDIGSGRSLFPIFLASKGHDVVSIDNDDVLMDRISPKLAEMSGVKVNYKTDNATNLNFNDNKFDRVFCISVLEHLEEELVNGKRVNYHKKNLDVKAIGEMLRVVKPNGLVVLTVEWSENLDDIQSYRIKDIYERLLKSYRSLLVEDKHLEVNWKALKQEHYEINKKFRPDYPATEGWAIGIILRKENY